MAPYSYEKTLAWLVHLYTASGIAFAFLSILEINKQNWSMAMIYMMICLFIDGTDGILARRAKVKETLPHVSGKDIDFVIDFVTYALLPAYFFYSADLAPSALALPLTLLILIVSTIYYGIQGMVTEDLTFRGFPVLWNLVVFYQFFVFQSSPGVNALMIVGFSILHFLPIQISYPSQHLRTDKWQMTMGLLALGGFVGILLDYPGRNIIFIGAAWIFMLYFGGKAIQHTWGRK